LRIAMAGREDLAPVVVADAEAIGWLLEERAGI
jgi:hypothetical protein